MALQHSGVTLTLLLLLSGLAQDVLGFTSSSSFSYSSCLSNRPTSVANNNKLCFDVSKPKLRSNNVNAQQLQMFSGFGLKSLFKVVSPDSRVSSKNVDTSLSSSDADGIPRINVKPRPRLTLDQSTGKYIRQQSEEEKKKDTKLLSSFDSSYDQLSGWDHLKDFVYDSIDSISGISGVAQKNASRLTSGVGGSSTNLNRNLAVAYSDTVEFKEQRSPMKSILAAEEPSPEPIEALTHKFESSLSVSNKDRSNGQDLYRSDTRKTFDSVKDRIYDLFSGGHGKKDNPSTTTTTTTTTMKKSPPIQNVIAKSTPAQSLKDVSVKAVSKPSHNKDTLVAYITPYLEDLHSNNPLKVLKAKLAIATEERKQKRRMEQYKQKEAIDGVKRMIFEFVDSIQIMYNTIIGLPDRIDEAIQATDYTIAQNIAKSKQMAKDVQAIPSKVQKAVYDAKQSVQDTQKAGLEAIDEVKAIPKKVEKTITNTKKSIEDTKKGVEEFAKKVDDFTFQAKVVAGIEKPKPKPPPVPPPPPPPKTKNEVAMEVVGTVAKLTGKTALVVGKGTIDMTATAAKLAFNTATSSIAAKKEEGAKVKQKTKIEATGSAASKARKIPVLEKKHPVLEIVHSSVEEVVKPVEEKAQLDMEVGEIDALLEQEISDALRSAEEALVTAQEEKSNTKSRLNKIQVNEALARARKAADKARKDAFELEAMLKKRNEALMK